MAILESPGTVNDAADDAVRRLLALNPDAEGVPAEQMDLLVKLAEAGAMPTLVPLLPVLLNLDGKPFTLDRHAPFEPMFKTNMARIAIWKCARQTGKSMSVAARMVAMAASIPRLKRLFITPLQEQCSRFSRNYLSTMIDGSPIRQLLISPKTIGNVFQKDFASGSRVQLSYAGQSVDRARGIPADMLDVDESFCSETTYVNSESLGKVLLKDISPGDRVESFDENGNLLWSKVLAKSYHGVRPCYRLTAEDGQYVDATPDTRLATTSGWLRVSQIVDLAGATEISSIPSSKIGRHEGRPKYSAEANGSGHSAGGWVSDRHILRSEAWLTADGVHVGEVPRVVRVRSRQSVALCYEQTRLLVGGLLDCRSARVQVFTGTDLSWRHQDGNAEVAGHDRRGRLPAVSGLVGVGRRVAHTEPESEAHGIDDALYSRLSAPRGGAADRVAVVSRIQVPPVHIHSRRLPTVPHHHPVGRVDRSSGRGPEGLDTSVHDVQVGAVGQDLEPDLYVLRQGIRPRAGVREEVSSSCPPSLVWVGGVLEGQEEARISYLRSGPGIQGHEELCKAGEVSRRSGIPTPHNDSKRHLGEEQPGGYERGKPALPGEEESQVGSRSLYVPSLLEDGDSGGRTRGPDCLHLVPSQVDQPVVSDSIPLQPVGRRVPKQRVEEESCGSRAGAGRLTGSNLVSIRYLGEKEVHDIEVESTHVFVANGIASSNCQDVDPAHFSILSECMSASPWDITTLTGTPKTPDNPIEEYWLSSSQAEWFVPCFACGKWNVPSLDHDLMKMIGPAVDDIGPGRPGLVCAGCFKPVDPSVPEAHWHHRRSELSVTNPGYHLAQTIMPIHFNSPEKWSRLVGKMEGRGNYTPEKFTNEVLGESCGVGVQLVSEADLRKAASVPLTNIPTDPAQAVRYARGRYRRVFLSVDWGGGGELWTSLTTLAVLGQLPTGIIEVVWGRRLLTPHAHLEEAAQVKHYFNLFECDVIVHDYSGAGELRETFLIQSGVPRGKVIPVRYVRATAAQVMTPVKPTAKRPRSFYQVDKARSLLTTCAAIRIGRIKFFQYDYKSADEVGLQRDFLALVENKVETRLGSDVYTIVRAPRLSDDFAQAVNIGACAIWYVSRSWPNVSLDDKYTPNAAAEADLGEDPELPDAEE